MATIPHVSEPSVSNVAEDGTVWVLTYPAFDEFQGPVEVFGVQGSAVTAIAPIADPLDARSYIRIYPRAAGGEWIVMADIAPGLVLLTREADGSEGATPPRLFEDLTTPSRAAHAAWRGGVAAVKRWGDALRTGTHFAVAVTDDGYHHTELHDLPAPGSIQATPGFVDSPDGSSFLISYPVQEDGAAHQHVVVTRVDCVNPD